MFEYILKLKETGQKGHKNVILILRYAMFCQILLVEHPEKGVFVTEKLTVTKTLSRNNKRLGKGCANWGRV